MWSRLASDFWPVDKSSIAPNLVASGIAFGLGYAVALRKRLNAIFTHLDELHRHHGIGKYRKTPQGEP